MLNLDTHVFIKALCGDLSARERRLLRQEAWGVSAIVLWELCKLVELRRLEMDLDGPDFVAALARVHVWPLSLEICRESTELDFKSDPADELIAATSVITRVPLLTRDKKILSSKIVPFARE